MASYTKGQALMAGLYPENYDQDDELGPDDLIWEGGHSYSHPSAERPELHYTTLNGQIRGPFYQDELRALEPAIKPQSHVASKFQPGEQLYDRRSGELRDDPLTYLHPTPGLHGFHHLKIPATYNHETSIHERYLTRDNPRIGPGSPATPTPTIGPMPEDHWFHPKNIAARVAYAKGQSHMHPEAKRNAKPTKFLDID